MATVFKRNKTGPWIIHYYDSTGRRREKSSRTTDRRAAQRLADKLESETMLEREGIVPAAQRRIAEHGRRPLREHIDDYLAHCERVGQAEGNIVEKRRHLARFCAEAEVDRLAGITPDVVVANMAAMVVERKVEVPDPKTGQLTLKRVSQPASARTRNFRRQVLNAFVNWCVRHARLENNPLKAVPMLDERNDRRRVRRPLTASELETLIRVAREQDQLLNADPSYPHGESRRAAWYMAAALAGLRLGDLRRLRWGQIDFERGCLTISDGKAKRTDVIPLHPQLAEELAALRPARMTPQAFAQAKVFPTSVTNATRLRDFERAGIKPDSEGRVADLHALRTTLGTMLARNGVAPQVAQRIMRHADYKTTLASYTVLGLQDTERAVSALPRIGTGAETQVATGTDEPQHWPQQSARREPQSGASARDLARGALVHGDQRKPRSNTGLRGAARPDAAKRVTGVEPATFSLGS